MRRALLSLVLGLGVTTALPARADLNETLDLSLHATRGRVAMSDPRVDSKFEVQGLGARLGWSLQDLRFGAGVGIYGPSSLRADGPKGTRAYLASGEAYIAYAPDGFWSLRPFLELRAHADRLQVGDAYGITRVGVGPRVGVLAPLSEYFFLDCGVGVDLMGSDEIRGTIGIGLPIPLSHL